MTSSPATLAPSPVLAMGRTLRIFLLISAILALATVAFMLGRVTVGSNSVPTRAPAVSTQLPTASNAGTCQHIGHDRSVAC
jgi:hypothetical protein